MGRRQFLPLVLELPRRPGLQVRDRLADDLRGLPDGVRAVARGIKPVEQTGERVKRLLPDKVAVLRDRQTGEVPRPPVLFQQHRLRRLRPELFDAGMEPRGQRGLLRLRQLRHIRVQIARQAERQLPAHERRKAAEGIEQPAVQPAGANAARQAAPSAPPASRRTDPACPAWAADGNKAPAGPAAARSSQSRPGAGSPKSARPPQSGSGSSCGP